MLYGMTDKGLRRNQEVFFKNISLLLQYGRPANHHAMGVDIHALAVLQSSTHAKENSKRWRPSGFTSFLRAREARVRKASQTPAPTRCHYGKMWHKMCPTPRFGSDIMTFDLQLHSTSVQAWSLITTYLNSMIQALITMGLAGLVWWWLFE